MILLKLFLFFIFCFFLPRHLSDEKNLIEMMIIWNVGQGSWATYASHNSCLHFDMGGEVYPQNISKYCQRKKNYLIISHFDRDHINFIQKFSKKTDLCLLNPRATRKRIQFKIPDCHNFKLSNILPFSKAPTPFQILPPPRVSKNENENSYVTLFESWIFPGDSSKSKESYWLSHIPQSQIRFLILSHHGSKTATSPLVLQKLTQVKMAFASARRKKYNHPHPEVMERLKHYNIPTLRTEDWGNIIIQLK